MPSSLREVSQTFHDLRIGYSMPSNAVALPSKPLNLIALSDADSGSALEFVQQKLHNGGVDVKLNKEQTAYLERLGGRASDLESVSEHMAISTAAD